MYTMRCDVCKRIVEIGVPITYHDMIIKPGIPCDAQEGNRIACVGTLRQVIVPPRHMFMKGSFPATGNEVSLPTAHGEDIKFKDKIHAREYLAEHGLTSKWIENDM